MIFILSPAKTLDYTKPAPVSTATTCCFLKEAEEISRMAKLLSPDDISSLMGVSRQLAELNHARFQQWQLPISAPAAKQALYAFKGDVYEGMSAGMLSPGQQAYLHRSLIILSGMYGLLRATDLMLPYRLEMGLTIQIGAHKNLYSFWGGKIAEAAAKTLSSPHEAIINLASAEYWKSAAGLDKTCKVITPVFKDEKSGKFKIVSFHAKRARGLMCRYAAENEIEDPEQLKLFNYEGYFFAPEQSSEKEWVFLRLQK
jgi:uncharacterized protein